MVLSMHRSLGIVRCTRANLVPQVARPHRRLATGVFHAPQAAVTSLHTCQLQTVTHVRCLPPNCVWCGVLMEASRRGAHLTRHARQRSRSYQTTVILMAGLRNVSACLHVRRSTGMMLTTVAATRARPSGLASCARTRRPHAHRLLVCRATSTVEALEESDSADPSAGLFELSDKQQAWAVMRRWSVGPPRAASTRAAEGATTVRPVVEAATAVAEGRSQSDADGDGGLHPVLELLAHRAVRMSPSSLPPFSIPHPACYPTGAPRDASLVDGVGADVQISGSRPGHRTDPYKLGLVVQGGGMRGVVSAGALTILHFLGLRRVFDATYGSSAGAMNLTYFLAVRSILCVHLRENMGSLFPARASCAHIGHERADRSRVGRAGATGAAGGGAGVRGRPGHQTLRQPEPTAAQAQPAGRGAHRRGGGGGRRGGHGRSGHGGESGAGPTHPTGRRDEGQQTFGL
jgi:hypothetical protein